MSHPLLRTAEGGVTRTVVRLENGLRAAVDAGGSSAVIAIQAWVQTRGPQVHPDLGHLLEHLLIESADSHFGGSLLRHLESLGGELNGVTGRDRMLFGLVLPRSKLAEGLDVISKLLFHPDLKEERVEHEIQILEREREQRQDRPELLSPLLAALMTTFRPHPPGDASWAEPGSSPSCDLVQRYHRSRIVPPRCVIAIAGAVELDRVTELCRSYFGDLPAGEAPAEEPPTRPLEPLYVSPGPPQGPCGLAIGYRVPDVSPSVESAWLALSLASLQAGSDVRDALSADGLAWRSQPNVECEDPLAIFSYLYLAPEESLSQIVHSAFEAVEQMRRRPMPLGLLERARWSLSDQYAHEGDIVQRRAGRLAVFELLKGGVGRIRDLAQELARATPETVRDVAAATLVPENRSVVAVVPTDRVPAVRRALRPLVVPSRRALRVAKRPDSHASAKRRTVCLPGGALLLEDPRPDTDLVALRLGFRDAGRRGERPATRGASGVLATSFGTGCGELPPGGSLRASSGFDALRLEVVCLRDLLPEWAERIYGCVVDPPDELVRQAIELSRAQTSAASADPEAVALDLARAALFGRHPYGSPENGTEAELAVLKPEAVHRFFRERVTLDRLYLVGSGGLEPGRLLDLAERLTTRLDLADRAKAVSDVVLSPRAGPTLVGRDHEAAELYFALAWRSGPASSEDRAALLIIDCSLSWFGGRLFRALREERALIYHLLTAERFCKQDGTYGLTFACRPEQALEAMSECGRILSEVTTRGLTPGELERCREACMGAQDVALSATEARADAFATEIEVDAPPGQHLRVRDEISEVTLDEVRRVASRLLRVERAALAVVGPDASVRLDELARPFFGGARVRKHRSTR